MNITHSLYIITIFSIILLVQSCLKPQQNDGQCTSCQNKYTLLEGRCFEKIRGCLQYQLKTQNELICIKCQNGYVIYQKQCERQAVVIEKETGKKVDNSPAPLIGSDSGILKQKDIENLNNETEKQKRDQSQRDRNSVQFQIPQIQIIVGSSQQGEFQENLLRQFKKYLDQIKPEFRKIQVQKIIKFSNQDHQKILFIAYLKDGSEFISQYHLDHQTFTILGFKTDSITQQLYNMLHQQKITIQFNVTNCKLYQFKEQANSTIYKIYDESGRFLNSSKLLSVKHQESLIQDLVSELQYKGSEKIRKIFRTAYRIFTNKLSIGNTPEIIQSIKVRVTKNEDNADIYEFQIIYGGRKQSASFQFDQKSMQVQIDGYFIEGQNILTKIGDVGKTLIKNITQKQIRQYVESNKQIKQSVGINIRILQISKHGNNYVAILVSEKGYFQIKLQVKTGNIIQLVQSENEQQIHQFSTQTCSDVTPSNETQKILLFFNKKYPLLSNYSNKLIQQKLFKNKSVIRILFQNQKYQQIQILVQKSLGQNPQYSLLKIVFLNQAYSLVQQFQNLPLIKHANSSQKLSNLIKRLQQKYNQYLKQSLIQGIFENKQNYKIYFQNSKFVLQAILPKKRSSKLILKALSRKISSVRTLYQKVGVPPLYTKNDLITQNNSMFSLINSLQKIIRRRYLFYFQTGFQGCMYLNKGNNNKENHQVAIICKSSFGIFEVDAVLNLLTNKTKSISTLKSISEWEPVKLLTKCSQQQIIDSTNNQCIQKIESCTHQIGQICMLCQPLTLKSNDSKTCNKQCSETMIAI